VELRDSFKNKLSSAQESDVMVELFHDLVAYYLMPPPPPSPLLRCCCRCRRQVECDGCGDLQLATTNNNDGTFTVDVLALATSQRPVQGRSRSFPGTFEVSIRVKETAAGAPPPCCVPLAS
jgi:hypothetical protein